MYKDINKSFRDALNSINYNTIAVDISDKMEDIKSSRKVKDTKSKTVKKLNKAFKDEKFDELTIMRYRKFRKEYQKERNAIIKDHNSKMNTDDNKFKILTTKINAIHDDVERRKKMIEVLSKNIKTKNTIRKSLSEKLNDFNEDYKYRAISCGLKWQYIIYDDMDI
jgi:chromosome segregation ATPase